MNMVENINHTLVIPYAFQWARRCTHIWDKKIFKGEYCDEHVCVCVCLSVHDHLWNYSTCLTFTKVFVHVTYRHGSVLLWRHSDKLCTSGFMDDVIIAHKLRLLGWGSEAHAYAALSLVHRNTRCRQRPLMTRPTSRSQGLLGRSGRVEYLWHHVCTNNVPAYTATRKWRVLKVTPQVATTGVESAVYDCLVKNLQPKAGLVYNMDALCYNAWPGGVMVRAFD